jgi:hypothetical protein
LASLPTKLPSLALRTRTSNLFLEPSSNFQQLPTSTSAIFKMGRGKLITASGKAKKPKTEIQRKREERRAKKPLPRPAPLPTVKPSVPQEKKDVKPKPKPQNPGSTKLSALFKRELTVIETHIMHSEQFRQHCRAEIDKMEGEEKKKWESGEVGNYVRLLTMMDRSREILAQAREMSTWIVCRIFDSLGCG